MSNLLISESPLQALPTLAGLLGDVELAIIIQQIHYIAHHSEHSHVVVSKEGEARRWARLSLPEWMDIEKGRLVWFSRSTLIRRLNELKRRGLIAGRQFGLERDDARMSYRVRRKALDALLEAGDLESDADFDSDADPHQPSLFDADAAATEPSLMDEPPMAAVSAIDGRGGYSISDHTGSQIRSTPQCQVDTTPQCQPETTPCQPDTGGGVNLKLPPSVNLTPSSIQEDFLEEEEEQQQQQSHSAPRAREAPAPPQADATESIHDSNTGGRVVVVDSDECPTPRTEAWKLLTDRGVSGKKALRLIRRHSDTEIRRQVCHLDFEQSQGKRLTNPAGRLVKMISDQWTLPPGAEAAYRRRFASGDAQSIRPPPAHGPEPEEPDALDLRLAALPASERTALREQAQEVARRLNPDMEGFQLEVQTIYHLRRLLRQRIASESIHDSENEPTATG